AVRARRACRRSASALAEELERVLTVTRASDHVFRGLDGEARYHLYFVGCLTGFRASALASLTPAHFDLDGAVPVVVLAAREDKGGKDRVQPLRTDAAKLLAAWIKDRPEGAPLWPGTWARDRKAAEMFRLDLEAAGVPYVVSGPKGPLFADFHALRHSYITALARGGVNLRSVQEL